MLLETQAEISDLRRIIKRKDSVIADKDFEIAQLKHMLFGKRQERFKRPDLANHPQLPFEIPPEEQVQLREETIEKISYERKKPSAKHPGRIPLPDHLPVEEVHVYPDGDVEEMTHIGTETTDELMVNPLKYYIRRTIRHKYLSEESNKIAVAPAPDRLFAKCLAGPSVIASVLVDKYVVHLPLYRQTQRFKREKIPIAPSTLEGWARKGLNVLDTLYQHLLKETRKRGYLQCDESPIKVQDKSCNQQR